MANADYCDMQITVEQLRSDNLNHLRLFKISSSSTSNIKLQKVSLMNTTAVVIVTQAFEINFDDYFPALALCQGQLEAVIDTKIQESEEKARVEERKKEND